MRDNIIAYVMVNELLHPIKQKDINVMFRAVVNCSECGKIISHHGGSYHNILCLDCAEEHFTY